MSPRSSTPRRPLLRRRSTLVVAVPVLVAVAATIAVTAAHARSADPAPAAVGVVEADRAALPEGPGVYAPGTAPSAGPTTTPPKPSTPPAATKTPGSAPPARPGWVAVDPAKQAADVAA